MIESVRWPHRFGSVILEGWEFDEPVAVDDVLALSGVVTEPPNIERGTVRWTEWVLGRSAAVRAAQRAGVVQPEIRVASTGAPFIAGSDKGLSIAHTRGLVLAAVASERIGIDVEKQDRNVSTLARSLHPGEVGIALSIGVIGCLVAKEAAAKATGLGLGGSLARWPVLDAELSGSSPSVSIGSPDGRVVSARLFPWKNFIVGVASVGEE